MYFLTFWSFSTLAQSVSLSQNTVCEFNDVDIVINDYASTIHNIEWQYSVNQTDWKTLVPNAVFSGINNDTLFLTAPSDTLNLSYYRCLIDSTNNSISDDTLTSTVFTVYSTLTVGNIGSAESVCFNTSPSPLSFIQTPSGGNGSYSYQWQNSTDGFLWNTIANANLNEYSINNLTISTSYRTIITSNCGIDTTNEIIKTVHPDLTNGTITATDTICYNASPSLIQTITQPMGGDGNFTYQWFQSLDATNWTSINGANLANYQPNNLTQTTYFRVEYINTCGTQNSNNCKVVVYDDLSAGAVGNNQSICYNTAPNALIFNSMPSGVDGNYTYQWQNSVDGINWNTISGETNAMYQEGNLTASQYYRSNVTSTFGCGTVNTNATKITVYSPFVRGNINLTDTICYNTTPNQINTTILPSGGDGSYTYQWYSSTDRISFSVINGATQSNYQPNNLTDTTLFFVNYINVCNSGNSDTNQIVVYPDLTNGTITATDTICYNASPSLIQTITQPTGGDGGFTYQWFQSLDATNWTSINGANLANYQPNNLTQTTYFRVEYINTCGTQNSNNCKVVVYDDLSAGTVGNNQSICYNTAPNALIFNSSPSGADGNYTYQWQNSVDSINWNTISGETNAMYQEGSLTASQYYRSNVTSTFGCGTVNTNSILITAYNPFSVGNISSADTTCYNTNPTRISTLNAPTGGDGNYTYQWYQSNDAVNFSMINNATQSNYQPINLTDTTYFYVDYINVCNSGISNTSKVVVYPELNTGSITASYTICYNTVPNSIQTIHQPTGGDGVFSFQWYRSNNGINWVQINGATQDNYQPSSLTTTTYYRVDYINSCGTLSSNTCEVIVFNDLNAGTIGIDQSICYNTTPNFLSFRLTPNGADGIYTYQWQRSTDNSIWNDISGETSTRYQESTLTSSFYYRNAVTSSFGCGTVNTNAIKVTVYDDFAVGSIRVNDTTCYDTNPNSINTTTPPTGGDEFYAYQWYQSNNNSNFTLINGATQANYQPVNLTDTSYYYVDYINICNSGISNTSKIVVYPELITGSITPTDTLCYNTIPSLIETIQHPTGGDGEFMYQWFQSNDGANWTQINSANDFNYQPSALTNTTYYRVDYINVCGTLSSNTCKVFVFNELRAGIIENAQAICYNTSPTNLVFDIQASGADGNYTYQWQKSGNTTTWSSISEETNTEFQEENLLNTQYYRTVITSTFGCGKDTTNVIQVLVYDEFKTSVIGEVDTICFDETPNKLIETQAPLGGDGTYSYQWQYKTISQNWTTIAQTRFKDYQPITLFEDTYYRVLVTAGSNCGQEYSNEIKIVVHPLPNDATITGERTVCNNQSDVVYQIDPINSLYAYKWKTNDGEITFGKNNAKSSVHWNGFAGNYSLSATQTVIETGCIKKVSIPVQILDDLAPDKTAIIRKSSSNILICEDENENINYQWGFDDLNTQTSTLIADGNLRYVTLPHQFDTILNRYWVQTSIEYGDMSCLTTSYFNAPKYVQVTESTSTIQISLVPNPTQGKIQVLGIDLAEYSLKIYDTRGNLVNYQISNNQVIKMDSEVSNGIYFISLRNSDHNYYSKFILNR